MEVVRGRLSVGIVGNCFGGQARRRALTGKWCFTWTARQRFASFPGRSNGRSSTYLFFLKLAPASLRFAVTADEMNEHGAQPIPGFLKAVSNA